MCVHTEVALHVTDRIRGICHHVNVYSGYLACDGELLWMRFVPLIRVSICMEREMRAGNETEGCSLLGDIIEVVQHS